MNFFENEKNKKNLSVLCRGRELKFDNVKIMGVLNPTPNSFSDGGKFLELNHAIEQIDKMTKEGADIIDIGGESTHPDSVPVSNTVELKRITPILERLDFDSGPLVSIDTRKPAVAKEVLKSGIHIINDIDGFTDEQMTDSVLDTGVGLIVMCPGRVKELFPPAEFSQIDQSVYSFFKSKLLQLKNKGLESVIIDPGIGFDKSKSENLRLINKLSKFAHFDVPIAIGISRKGFVGTITRVELPRDRLIGSVVAESFAAINGANIIRTHDVKHTLQGLDMIRSLMDNYKEDFNC
tara:strand:- start:1948 stop:2826 length:879 start_codon:yes stop_codon:yes gene_type:complete